MPVDTTVRVQVTADPLGVIHAFAVPSFGIKIDAVPGRLNETWFNARETGIYYGQCSELCGKDHAFMPIAVRVVTKEEFAAYMAAFEGWRLCRRQRHACGSAVRTRVRGHEQWLTPPLTSKPTRPATMPRRTCTSPPAGAAGSIRPTTRTSA